MRRWIHGLVYLLLALVAGVIGITLLLPDANSTKKLTADIEDVGLLPTQTAGGTGTPTNTPTRTPTRTPTTPGAPTSTPITPVATRTPPPDRWKTEAEYPSRLGSESSASVRLILHRQSGELIAESEGSSLSVATPRPFGTPGMPLDQRFSDEELLIGADLTGAGFKIDPTRERLQSLDQTFIEWRWSVSSALLGQAELTLEVYAVRSSEAAPGRYGIWLEGLPVKVIDESAWYESRPRIR
jgi:hypothetical protein